jgi:ABC-type transport system involved in cytochrome bd biosynthesis fused ATPase/permease subunit
MQGFDRQSAVRFENVEKSFGDVKVLKDFDLEVQPGEFVVLLGASGSGKTTALPYLIRFRKAICWSGLHRRRKCDGRFAKVPRYIDGFSVLCALSTQNGGRQH